MNLENAPTAVSSTTRQFALRGAVIRWGLGPIATALLSALFARGIAHWSAPACFDAPTSLSGSELARYEGTPATAVADIAWALADTATTKRVLQSETQRLVGREGWEAARVFFRYALIDENPDGRRALVNNACVAHLPACNDIQATQRQQANERLVLAPALPPGHPALDVSAGSERGH